MFQRNASFFDGEQEGCAAIYARGGRGEILGTTPLAVYAREMIGKLKSAINHG